MILLFLVSRHQCRRTHSVFSERTSEKKKNSEKIWKIYLRFKGEKSSRSNLKTSLKRQNIADCFAKTTIEENTIMWPLSFSLNRWTIDNGLFPNWQFKRSSTTTLMYMAENPRGPCFFHKISGVNYFVFYCIFDNSSLKILLAYPMSLPFTPMCASMYFNLDKKNRRKLYEVYFNRAPLLIFYIYCLFWC